MIKHVRFISLFFLLFSSSLNAYPYRSNSTKWAVTAHLLALITHFACPNQAAAAAISTGCLGGLYGWDNLVNEYCEVRHKRNFYCILAGYAGGWFCGRQLRLVAGI